MFTLFPHRMIGILFSDTSYKGSILLYHNCTLCHKTDINALDPVSDGGEGPLAGHVVQQHHPVRPPEVGLGHTPEPAHEYAIIPI